MKIIMSYITLERGILGRWGSRYAANIKKTLCRKMGGEKGTRYM